MFFISIIFTLIKNNSDRLDADFICRRGVLKAILCSPYQKFEEWTICACKYRGTIYLCDFSKNENQGAHVYKHNVYTTWGYKFEQYMVAGILYY